MHSFKISFMSFNKCLHLCSYYHHQDTGHFPDPSNLPVSRCSWDTPNPCPRQTFIWFLLLWLGFCLHINELLNKWNNRVCTLGSLAFSNIVLISIHILCISSSSFLTGECYSIVWLYLNLFVHSPLSGFRVVFFLCCYEYGAVNIPVQASCLLLSLWIARSRVAGSFGKCMFNLTAKLNSQAAAQFCIPKSSAWEFWWLRILGVWLWSQHCWESLWSQHGSSAQLSQRYHLLKQVHTNTISLFIFPRTGELGKDRLWDLPRTLQEPLFPFDF